ncbi:MAG: class I SAM-dependent methyltransferase [Theionarchaea archaeon]|nr:class I SAM-dependent methyltransferase [Theionarchaea archaeon]
MKEKGLEYPEKESRQLKEYWESRRKEWEKSEHEDNFGYRIYRERMLKRLEGVEISLEIGFGDGRWIKLLESQGIRAFGIDIMENAALKLGKEGFSPVIADARSLPFKDDTFDLTFSFGVVEHFEGTEVAVAEHMRVTRPGGKIIITVPHIFSPYTIYWMLMHVKRGTFSDRPASFGKRYSTREFRNILERFDVTDIRVEPFVFPIPRFRKIYHENPVLNRVGWMIWTEMVKKD